MRKLKRKVRSNCRVGVKTRNAKGGGHYMGASSGGEIEKIRFRTENKVVRVRRNEKAGRVKVKGKGERVRQFVGPNVGTERKKGR